MSNSGLKNFLKKSRFGKSENVTNFGAHKWSN